MFLTNVRGVEDTGNNAMITTDYELVMSLPMPLIEQLSEIIHQHEILYLNFRAAELESTPRNQSGGGLDQQSVSPWGWAVRSQYAKCRSCLIN